MNNLAQRFITAVIAGSAAVTVIVLSPYGLMFFCAIVALAGLYEFLGWVSEKKSYRWVSLVIGAAIWLDLFAGIYWGYPPETLIWGMMPATFIILALLTLFNKEESAPVSSLGGMVLGFVYCYLPLILLYKLSWHSGEYDYRIPLGILILTWGLDVGAYFAGKFLGSRPLFPRISPKKTWEGSIGGAAICFLLAFMLTELPFASEGISFSWWVIAGIIAVFSQYGDLVESMFKRSVDIKDSGSILPGHGGMLDRFDGIYVSVPLIYAYFLCC